MNSLMQHTKRPDLDNILKAMLKAAELHVEIWRSKEASNRVKLRDFKKQG